MTIVFFILLFFVLPPIIVIFSTIKIKVKELNISNIQTKQIRYDYVIDFELLFFDKIRIIKTTLNPDKVKSINNKVDIKQKIEDMNLNEKTLNKKEIKEVIKKLNVKLEQIHLDLEIGTEDALITSGIVAVIASFLGILFAKVIKCYEEGKYGYKVMPIYQNKNAINLLLNCIIQVKVIHIISIIFTIVKNRKEKEEYERTSNRRSYDYSYE